MKGLKTLCKAKKSHHSELREEILQAVRQPKYICRKCLRVAAKKKYLCSPERLDDWQP